MSDIVETGRAPVTNPFGAVAAPAAQMNAIGAAMEQRAIAEVQASFVMAQRFPRDEAQAFDRIINAFGRASLAERATYEYSRGGSEISGPSIRAAEAIAQQWGNIDVGFSEAARFRDDRGIGVSMVRAQAVDLQSRARKYIDFHVRHWRDTKKGGYALTDERDIYELIANQAQRRVRACILALVPGDVVEAAMHQAEVTLKANVDTGPEGIRKTLEAFEQFGVTKEQIEKRIQRRIDTIQSGQMVVLRRIYASLRDGMSSPAEWFEVAEATPEADEAITRLNAKITSKAGPSSSAPPASKPEEKPEVATKPDEPGQKPAEVVQQADAPPRLTYAQIIERMKAAKTVDEIDEVGSLHLESYANVAERKELLAEFKRLRAALESR